MLGWHPRVAKAGGRKSGELLAASQRPVCLFWHGWPPSNPGPTGWGGLVGWASLPSGVATLSFTQTKSDGSNGRLVLP